MPSFDFLAYLPNWAAPVILVLVMVFFFISRFAEAYDGVAKMVPIIGKHWRKRGLRRDQEKERQIMTLAETLVDRMPRPDYEVLSQEMEHVKQRIQYMEAMELINQSYLIEDAKWHNHVDIAWREAQTPPFDLPPRINYTEFVRKWRDENWRPDPDRPV